VPEDRDGFVEMNRDPGVRKYFPGLLTPEESLGEMTRIEQHWDTHGFGPWALYVRGDFAGILGLKWVSPDVPFAPAVELLYRLIPGFWGQGLATEGSLAALEFGFCELHLDTVVAFAVEANTGSRRVMEKVGMVYGSDFDHPSIPELSLSFAKNRSCVSLDQSLAVRTQSNSRIRGSSQRSTNIE